jgi:Recombination endonuclease VII
VKEEQKKKKRVSSLKYYYAHKERVRAATKKWFDNLPEKKQLAFIEKRKKKSKAWRKRNPRDRRDRRGERFGISSKEYQDKRDQQRKNGDLCGLCKRPLGERAHLDHNHLTNELRDFIHRDCNLAIGLLEDDPKLCRLAAEYLERHGEQHVQS